MWEKWHRKIVHLLTWSGTYYQPLYKLEVTCIGHDRRVWPCMGAFSRMSPLQCEARVASLYQRHGRRIAAVHRRYQPADVQYKVVSAVLWPIYLLTSQVGVPSLPFGSMNQNTRVTVLARFRFPPSSDRKNNFFSLVRSYSCPTSKSVYKISWYNYHISLKSNSFLFSR